MGVDDSISKGISQSDHSYVSPIESSVFSSEISLDSSVLVNDPIGKELHHNELTDEILLNDEVNKFIDNSVNSEVSITEETTNEVILGLTSSTTVNDTYGSDRDLPILTDSVSAAEVASYTGTSYVLDGYYVDNVDGFVIKQV